MERFVMKGVIGGAVLGAGLVLFYLRNYDGEDFGALLFLFGFMVMTGLAVAGGGYFALNWNTTEHFHAEEQRRLARRAAHDAAYAALAGKTPALTEAPAAPPAKEAGNVRPGANPARLATA